MVEKHLKFLGVTFIVLFILVIFTESPAFKKGRMPKEVEVSGEFKEDEVGSILIKKGDEKLELKKINGIWTVTEDSVPRPADKDRVVRLINNLSFLKGKVVGKSESEFPSYQVDEKNGTFLTLFDKNGKKIFEIIVGKQGPDFSTNFVRFPDSKEVILVEKALRPQVSSLRTSTWRNRRITNFDYEKVTKLEYEDENQRYMFYKEGDKWYLDSPEINADQAKIKRYIRMVSTIYSTGYVDTLDVKEYNSKKPFLTINVTLENGEKHGFKVIEKIDENKYIVKREGDDFTLYTLAKGYVENSLKKDREWFIAEEKKEEKKKEEEKKK